MAVNGKISTDEQVTLLPQEDYLISLMTTLRDSLTDSAAFVNAFEKVAGQLMIAALKHVPTEPTEVITPTGRKYYGVKQVTPVCGVSILRAGASMENALRSAYTGPLSYGKILIQRNEETCLPVHLYSKFPANIASKIVFVLEPMLATGGSASRAIELLKEAGVNEANIVFVNLIASREGTAKIITRFPALKLVTAAIDDDMTPSNHIAPGLGDFGDRFYGTTE